MTIPDTEPITSALRLLFEPGDTFEIRIFDAERAGYRRPHIESGYFDYEHIDDVPQILAEISTALGVYVTMNPVNPALLARSTNHLGAARRNETTSNCDIVRRRWMLIDIDPARPAGISATDGEKDLAFSKATEIREGLTGKDWPSPIFMDSGNGYYLLYRIDIPPDDNELVHRCLQALQPLADDEVHIDLSVANSARICRVAGTWNRKGDNVPDRPHRLSEIVSAPESPEVVPVALMEELASKAQGAQDETARETPGKPVTTNGDRPGDDFNQRGDLVPILEAHGWQLTGKSKGNQLWRRPRKTSGKHSATFDGRTFYVFSSDAPPFEANRGYARFAVYAHLEHDGDFSAASSALAAQGYGGDSMPGDGDASGMGKQHNASRTDHIKNFDSSPDTACTETSEDDPCSFEQPLDPGPLPGDLLHIPGFIEQVASYAMATAPYPNRALAFCGALCLQSYLAARRVKDRLNNRSNIYIVALANSGVGKDHPRQVNSEIAYRSGALRGLGDAFASGEGIEDAMFVQQAMLFQTDEIDAILGSIDRTRDGRNEMVMQILLKMYSSACTRYPLRKKAGQTKPLIIQQPSLTLFGTAVPQYFYKALSGRMLNNGLFARTLVLDAGSRSRGRMPAAKPVPEAIIDTATWWTNFNPGGVQNGNLSGFFPEPALVPDTPDATARSEAIWALTDDAYEEAQPQGDETKMAIWARAYEKVRKLALLYACSENHENPEITVAGVDWAWNVIEHQTRRMLYMADLYVADSEFEADCKRFIEVLSKWHAKKRDTFMAHWEISRRLRWSEKKIAEVRESLIAQKLIEVEMPQRGPMKPRYRLRDIGVRIS